MMPRPLRRIILVIGIFPLVISLPFLAAIYWILTGKSTNCSQGDADWQPVADFCYWATGDEKDKWE